MVIYINKAQQSNNKQKRYGTCISQQGSTVKQPTEEVWYMYQSTRLNSQTTNRRGMVHVSVNKAQQSNNKQKRYGTCISQQGSTVKQPTEEVWYMYQSTRLNSQTTNRRGMVHVSVNKAQQSNNQQKRYGTCISQQGSTVKQPTEEVWYMYQSTRLNSQTTNRRGMVHVSVNKAQQSNNQQKRYGTCISQQGSTVKQQTEEVWYMYQSTRLNSQTTNRRGMVHVSVNKAQQSNNKQKRYGTCISQQGSTVKQPTEEVWYMYQSTRLNSQTTNRRGMVHVSVNKAQQSNNQQKRYGTCISQQGSTVKQPTEEVWYMYQSTRLNSQTTNRRGMVHVSVNKAQQSNNKQKRYGTCISQQGSTVKQPTEEVWYMYQSTRLNSQTTNINC